MSKKPKIGESVEGALKIGKYKFVSFTGKVKEHKPSYGKENRYMVTDVRITDDFVIEIK